MRFGHCSKPFKEIDRTFLYHQWVTVASMAAVPGVDEELSVGATFFINERSHFCGGQSFWTKFVFVHTVKLLLSQSDAWIGLSD